MEYCHRRGNRFGSDDKKGRRKTSQSKSCFHSFVIMACAALIFCTTAVFYFEFPIREYIWPAVAAVLAAVLFLVVLYHIQKKQWKVKNCIG